MFPQIVGRLASRPRAQRDTPLGKRALIQIGLRPRVQGDTMISPGRSPKKAITIKLARMQAAVSMP